MQRPALDLLEPQQRHVLGRHAQVVDAGERRVGGAGLEIGRQQRLPGVRPGVRAREVGDPGDVPEPPGDDLQLGRRTVDAEMQHALIKSSDPDEARSPPAPVGS